MSLCMRKPTIGFPTWSNINLAVQSQKMDRGWKFWIYVEEQVYFLCSENKHTDTVTAKLICVFVFTYAKLLVFPCGGSYSFYILVTLTRRLMQLLTKWSRAIGSQFDKGTT